MKRVAIISSGYFPVPAVRGGAVETIIEKLIQSNDETDSLSLTVYSTFDKKAEKISKKYDKTKVVYVKDKLIVEKLDKLIYTVAKSVIKNEKQMSFRYILHRIAYITEVAKMIHKEIYDYIIIENTATLFWIFRLYNNRKRYENSIIYHVHNEIDSSFGNRKLINQCKQILGVSEFINKTIQRKYPFIDESKFIVFPNCIDTDKIISKQSNRDEIRKKLKLNKDDFVFIFVGRLCKAKGVEELLKAFLKIENPKAKLLIVGNYYFGTNLVSKFEDYLRVMIENKAESIIFTGFVANDDIGSYYSAADVAVLPSIWEEPAGLTIIEAMSSAIPVITTYSGGIPEYVGKGNAVLLNKNDKNFIDKLKDSMMYFMENKKEIKTMGNMAQQRALEFDYKQYAQKIARVIDNIEENYE